MKQTPAHRVVNQDLLGLMPDAARRVVEVGCMHGALAQAYRSRHPGTHYTGIDIDPDYAREAAAHCQHTLVGDIEAMADAAFDTLFPSDCWVFGDCLEHLRDPWQLLRRIRERIDADSCVVACIPNAQHWSVIQRLAAGHFHYGDSGLLDRTHLRWFTRLTMLELFSGAGWRIVAGVTRAISQAPQPVEDAVRSLARAAGVDEAQAARDCQVFQFVFKAVPA